MKSDIEIAREVSLRKIKEIATGLGIPREEVQNYGRYIAKIPIHLIDEEKIRQHNLILVTAITPTKAGIGKTTVSIGLALGLNKIGKKAVVALREPSLGPCFGMKGGGVKLFSGPDILKIMEVRFRMQPDAGMDGLHTLGQLHDDDHITGLDLFRQFFRRQHSGYDDDLFFLLDNMQAGEHPLQ